MNGINGANRLPQGTKKHNPRTVGKTYTLDGQPKIKYEKSHRVQDRIGQGGFATVVSVDEVTRVPIKRFPLLTKREENKKVGKKVALENDGSNPSFISEAHIRALICKEMRLANRVNSGPNIIAPTECVEYSGSKRRVLLQKALMIMPEAKYGDMLDFMNHIFDNKDLFQALLTRFHITRELFFARIIKDIVSALSYCHEKGIVHRDIKPENILLSADGSGKLCDFGCGSSLDDVAELMTVAGTLELLAPECVVRPRLYGVPSEKQDVWSLGCVLYQFITDYMPWDTYGDYNPFKENASYRRIKIASYIDYEAYIISKCGLWQFIQLNPNMQATWIDLTQRLLRQNPYERPSMADVMEHPWLNQDELPSHETIAAIVKEFFEKKQ
ncbi:serine/threonine-protein kinase [Thermoproteota archaeon]